jgi:hypothetical protein
MRFNSKQPPEKSLLGLSVLMAAAIILSPCFSYAEETVSASGRLGLRGVQEIESDSVEEDPSIEGRLKISAGGPVFGFHSWLEGGWDGSVKRPARDNSLFKSYDEVYQSNTPYLEFKELYASCSSRELELRAGIQRFAWGRIDEYPSNDLLNPWGPVIVRGRDQGRLDP